MVWGGVFVAAALGATVGTVGLIRYLRRYRDKPGADWFLASLACQALWTGCYGLALFVPTPGVRWALEVAMLGLLAGLSLFFLAFALEYTGRGQVRGRTSRLALASSPVATALVCVTNPLHHLFWRDYGIDPVAGLATVEYAFEPLGILVGSVAVVLPLVGSLLLFDTVLSYGPLYRREAVAVGLSTLPPAVGFALWLYGIGPYPQVNFAAVAFLPHVVLDVYAFVGNDMFEFHPATRREGERAAIDDLGSPVVVVDERARVVTLNGAAEDVLGVEKGIALTEPLGSFLDDSVDPTAETQRVSVDTGGLRRTFSVTSTPLDAGGDHLGYTLVWQDVTDELRREQRLEVLNRVLRHNLRNDMGVVRGFVTSAGDRVDDDRVAGMLDTAVDTADDLLSLGATAREIERVLEDDPQPASVDLGAVLSDVVAEARADAPGATIELDTPATTVTTDRTAVRAVCAELVDNAVTHGGATPTVAVTTAVEGDRAVVRVTDDGPGIPETELAVIEAGEETKLDHGSGLGLWLVRWGAERLRAEVEFETDGDGTTVTLAIPGATRT
jgi:signal transduction histidine kinase